MSLLLGTTPDPTACPLPGDGPRVPFTIHPRYPEPAVGILHPSFAPLRVYSASVEQLHTGCRWAEGPVWFGDHRCLLWSDIPADRILRWDAASGRTSVFRAPAGHANGHVRDAQGRLVSCEHLGRRVTRTEQDGRITVLADAFEGRRLNSPNDIVCQRETGDLWFTDPTFGIHGWWEGEPAPSERPAAVYRIRAADGALECLIDDLAGPNGLAFSPDGRTLYVVDSRARPSRQVLAWDIDGQGRLTNRRVHIDADGPGALDGITVDVDGRLWCGWGSDGRDGADAAALDGVRCFDRDGRPIGHIHLPERCANLTFGGDRRNRLFMAASHSLYAIHVNTQGLP